MPPSGSARSGRSTTWRSTRRRRRRSLGSRWWRAGDDPERGGGADRGVGGVGPGAVCQGPCGPEAGGVGRGRGLGRLAGVRASGRGTASWGCVRAGRHHPDSRGGDVKPPFAYYGGKTGMAQRIVSLLPPHKSYIEPFFGSGAVLFAKPPAMCEIVNDLDHSLVTFFRVLRDRTDELVDVCALTPHARAEYQAAGLDEDLDDLERARRFWVGVKQAGGETCGRQGRGS